MIEDFLSVGSSAETQSVADHVPTQSVGTRGGMLSLIEDCRAAGSSAETQSVADRIPTQSVGTRRGLDSPLYVEAYMLSLPRSAWE